MSSPILNSEIAAASADSSGAYTTPSSWLRERISVALHDRACPLE